MTAAALVAIVLVMCRPSLSDMRSTLPQNLGDPALNTWILSWQSHALIHDPSAWFDGNIFATHGSALGYSEIMLPLVPIFGAIEAVSGSSIVAHNGVILIVLSFSMAATYLLARRMNCSRLSAVVAASGFTFSSFTYAHIGHLQLLTFGFFPLGLLCVMTMLERQRVRDGLIVGAVSAALITACLYYATIWVPIVAVVVLVDLFRLRGRPGRRWWTALAAAAGSSAALVAPVAYVYLRFQNEVQFSRPLIPEFGADASDFLAPAPDSYLYRTLANAAWTRPGANEHSFFPGVVVLGLGVTGLLVGASLLMQRKRTAGSESHASIEPGWWYLAAAATTSLVISVGPTFAGLPAPFRFAYNYLPGFDSIRVPARLVVPFLLVLAVVAGRAVTWAIEHLRLPAIGLPVALLALMLVELSAPVARVSAKPDAADAALYVSLASLPAGIVVEIPAAAQTDGPAGVFAEGPRMLYSLGDWRGRFNGTSGGDPPGFADEVRVINTFPSNESLELLEQLDIRYVVLRSGEGNDPFTVSAETLDVAVDLLAPSIVATFDGMVLIDLDAVG